jgi:Pyridoxal-dependent decarboxylase conserved domain.
MSRTSYKKLPQFCVADQSNSSIEKAGLLGSMLMRLLPTDDKCRLRGKTLEQAIKSDREKGLIPCYVSKVTSTFKQTNKRKDNRMQTKYYTSKVS